MRVAIACPGPSLSRTVEGPGFARARAYDAVIGVNKAVEAVACDWWVFADRQCFGWFTPTRGQAGLWPRLCVGPGVMDHIFAEPYGEDFRAVFQDRGSEARKLTTTPAGRGWMTFTTAIAIVLGQKLGATTITLVGCDLAGERDFTGQPWPRRDATRWHLERTHLGWVIRWCRSRGAAVKRITPATPGSSETKCPGPLPGALPGVGGDVVG